MKPQHILIWAEPWIAAFVRDLASRLHLNADVVQDFEQAKSQLRRKSRAGLPYSAIVFDSDDALDNLDVTCTQLNGVDNQVSVVVMDRGKRKGRSRADLEVSEATWDLFGNRLQLCRLGDTTAGIRRMTDILRTIANRRREVLSTDTQRVLPWESINVEDDHPMEPNELATQITTALAHLSSSMHLRNSQLRKNYVEMLEAHQDGKETGKTKWSDEAKSQWKKYLRAKPVDRGKVEVDELPPDHNALARFMEVLFLQTRYTFLILGEKGCGKTTFLRHFFNNYLPCDPRGRKSQVFFVDFLRYDFVRDAQVIAIRLQEEVFGLLKETGELPQEFSNCNTFSEFKTHDSYTVTSLLEGTIPPNLAQQIDAEEYEYVETVLSGKADEEIAELYEWINGKTPTDDTQVKAWREQILVRPEAKVVCRIVAHFAKQALKRREHEIAQQILQQAIQRESLKGGLNAVGIDPKTGQPPAGLTVEMSVANLLLRLSKDGHVFLVIDNADRSAFQSVELEIFRTAWEFLPRAKWGRLRFVFAMRKDTYYRHGVALTSLGRHLGIEDVANVHARTVLRSPTFLDVAKVRIANLKEEFRKNGDDKSARIMTQYVENVLTSEVSRGVFDSLFEGDLRRTLDLFELAVASPHMVATDAYFFARESLNDEVPKTAARLGATFVKRHRLITSLLLGPWKSFRQQRSYVFLNIFNARLSVDEQEGWRNTLAIPRFLELLHSQPHASSSRSDMVRAMNARLGFSPQQVFTIIDLLLHYRLIAAAKEEHEASRSEAASTLVLTKCGRYYFEQLLHSLEYIQAVYWDVSIPKPLVFPGFATKLPISKLYPFCESFCEFIACEETFEEQARLAQGTPFDDETPDFEILATKIRQHAGGQVSRIYWSLR